MRIVLTKLTDARHALEVIREGGDRERVELETRSCLVHDLTATIRSTSLLSN